MDFEAIAARNAVIAREEAGNEKALNFIMKDVEETQREIGFSARLLVQATLPHSKPEAGVTEFERSNGLVRVHIQAPQKYGLPYGTYPRLLLAWVTTEAVRTKSRELELGDSLAAFMTKLNLSKSGGEQGSAPRLRQHMQRLFSSTVSAEYQKTGQWERVAFCPIEGTRIFWDPKNDTQGTLWRSTIQLHQRFFEEITRQPVPLDMHALRALAVTRSPMAIDIYCWMTHRFSYLREPITIPWESLQLQFGGDYARTRAFRAKFLSHLKHVLQLYPQANVEQTNDGLLLRPSKTHVPMRLIRKR